MTRSDHARLGLFLLVSVALAIAATTFFVLRHQSRPRLPAVTYFDESVTGLAPGATVRFRGVDIGRVERLFITPGDGLIEVRFEIYLDILGNLGLDRAKIDRVRQGHEEPDPRIRVRLDANPITGLANLQIEPLDPPPAPLPMKPVPGRAYIPSAPSTVGSLVMSAGDLFKRLPVLVERFEKVMESVDRTITEAQVGAVITDLRRTMASTEQMLKTTGDDLHRLLDDKGSFQQLLVRADTLLTRADADLHQLLGKKGELTRFLAGADTLVKRTGNMVERADIPAAMKDARTTLADLQLVMADLRAALPRIVETSDRLGGVLRNVQEQPESLIFGPRSK